MIADTDRERTERTDCRAGTRRVTAKGGERP